MDSGPRQTLGAPCPGTDPAALRLITAAVLAGLMVSGIVVISHRGLATGSAVRAVRPGAQAQMDRNALPFVPVVPVAPPARVLAPLQHGPGRSIRPARPAAPFAVRLLSQAAAASRAAAYDGVEVLDGWSQAGSVTSVVHVWHSPGGVTVTQAVSPVPTWSGGAPHILLPAGAFGGETMIGGATLGMSPRLVMLLATNYRVMTGGWGLVAGRLARVVTARWPGGELAARFWLDRATRLPLRRQTFDPAGQVISNAAFVKVRVGHAVGMRIPGTVARPWGDSLATTQLTALRAQGWPLPGPLPGDLALLGARQDVTRAGRVVDLDYSDGLSLVSVFLQRGHLPPRLNGWSVVALRGRQVYADESSGQGISWSARGFVYTVVAAAPQQTVGQVVAALPYDGNPGLVTRLGRGLHRLFSWLSPSDW
jgi:sigma-E factor negative regulatory protein RseB